MGAVRNVTGGNEFVEGLINPLGAAKRGLESISGMNALDRAARRGATAQERATALALKEQRAAREQMTQQLQPYTNLGQSVLGRLGDVAGQQIDYSGLPSVLPTDIGADSLFNALKQQAVSAIESSAAARGKLFSGTTPQAIAQQVQNLALSRAGDIQAQNLAARQQLLGERIGQQERQYQQLFNIGSLGQASAAQQAANIQGTASNIGELYAQQANARAAGLLAPAQMQANLFGQILGAGAKVGGAYLGRA